MGRGRDAAHPDGPYGDQAAAKSGDDRGVPVRPVSVAQAVEEEPLGQDVGRVRRVGLRRSSSTVTP